MKVLLTREDQGGSSFASWLSEPKTLFSGALKIRSFLTAMCLLFRFDKQYPRCGANYVLFYSQARHFDNFGMYVAMSICQGGSGFPYLADSVYTYMCTGKCTDVAVASADAPDSLLQFVLEKVNFFKIIYFFSNCYHKLGL